MTNARNRAGIDLGIKCPLAGQILGHFVFSLSCMKLNGGSRGFKGNRELVFESCLKKCFKGTDYKFIVSVIPRGGGVLKCIRLLGKHHRTFALTGTKYPTCPSTCVS